MRGLALAIVVVICAVAACETVAQTQSGVSIEAAAASARALAARKDMETARAIVRATNAYASTGAAARGLPETQRPAFEALLATHAAVSVDWLVRDEAMRARIRNARTLIGAIRQPAKAKPETVAAAIGDETCQVLLDVTAIRPGEVRVIVTGVLEAGLDFADDQKRCLVRAVAANPEFAHGDLPPLGQLAAAKDDAALALLIQMAAAQGSFSQALAFAAETSDPAQRARMQAAVVATRQFDSIALPEPDLLRALWANTRQRSGPERLLFGSLLAVRAPAGFWTAEAAAIAEFANTDATARAVIGLAARRALVSAPPDARAALWAAAPGMRPPAEFLVLHAALSDPATQLAIPQGADPALVRAIRVARTPASAFERVLSEFPSGTAGALDVAVLVISAIGAPRGE
ncbi:hypothetical protein [Hyphomonas sp.]|jgi:hypothetical protein|uniref:hypothetical protein n=1 Tax=Hyphomonas sp. TaxID=87 RepID=UPI0037BEE996